MSATDPTGLDREPGRTYIVEGVEEGEAWELGWDPESGWFFAQQLELQPDQMIRETDTRIVEPAAFERLAAAMSRPVPADIARELFQDAMAFPATGDATGIVADWAASIYRQLGIVPRWSLPAAPVAEVIREHAGEWRNRPELRVAQGMGFDGVLAAGVLDGTISELGIDEIAHVCDVLRCSPFDLWGTDLARSVLHAYGPEHWPRYIEPLGEEGPSLPRPPLVAVPDLPDELEAPDDTAPLPQAARDDLPLRPMAESDAIITTYREAGIIAIDASGRPVEIWEVAHGHEQISAFHLVLRQAADPRPISLPVHGLGNPFERLAADPSLEHARAPFHQLDPPGPGAPEFTRLTWRSGVDVWLHWEPDKQAWEFWADPRSGYAGPAADIVDPAGFFEPERWLTDGIELPAPQSEPPPPAPVPEFQPGTDVIVTGYRHTATFAITTAGDRIPVADTATADNTTDYHFAFQQVTRPSIYALFGYDQASAGDGVDPFLASVASYRRQDIDAGPGGLPAQIDMVRISPTAEGRYQPGEDAWLGWDPDTETWELWDDPRRHYPGPASDVLDHGRHIEPELWDAAKEMAAINTHDSHGIPGLGAGRHLTDGQELTERPTDEPPSQPEPPSLEF